MGFAADHVYGEVYRRLTKLAATSSASVEDLRVCFEAEYLPGLRWVTVSEHEISDERVKLVRDDTDVPTAQLAALVAPCLVVSGDKHLRHPGIAPMAWRHAAGHGAEIVRASSEQEGAVLAVGLPTVAAVGAGIKLGRVARLPWWASASLMAGGVSLLLRSPERRAAVWQRLGPFVESMFEVLMSAAEREAAAARDLKPTMLQPVPHPTVKQQLATVLARAPEPLLVREIAEQVKRDFDDVPTLAEIRDTLVGSSEFTEPQRHRWQLGRISSPWSAS